MTISHVASGRMIEVVVDAKTFHDSRRNEVVRRMCVWDVSVWTGDVVGCLCFNIGEKTPQVAEWDMGKR